MGQPMHTLGFGILWTALAFTGLFFLRLEPEFTQQELFFRIIITLMPFAGCMVVWDGVRKLRRFRSVRRAERRAQKKTPSPCFTAMGFVVCMSNPSCSKGLRGLGSRGIVRNDGSVGDLPRCCCLLRV